MDSDKQRLYFIAILPPLHLRREVEDIKRYFAEIYQSRHALKSPAHITLLMPFRWPQRREPELIRFLSRFASGISPFQVSLKNFAAFPRRVIYIDVEKNEAMETLAARLTEQIRRELKIFKDTYKNQGFTPHMTIAHRDLKPVTFMEAWPEFSRREFKAGFAADKITLLKHSGQKWEIQEEFPFPESGSSG